MNTEQMPEPQKQPSEFKKMFWIGLGLYFGSLPVSILLISVGFAPNGNLLSSNGISSALGYIGGCLIPLLLIGSLILLASEKYKGITSGVWLGFGISLLISAVICGFAIIRH